jgi:hypothetical protein
MWRWRGGLLGEYLARLAGVEAGVEAGVKWRKGVVVEHRRSTVPGDGLCLCWITGGRACMFLALGRCVLLVSAPIV